MIHYYATPKLIKTFNQSLAEKEETIPSFPDMLLMMQEQGLLMTDPDPALLLDGRMSKEEFMDAYDSIPFMLDQQLDSFSRERESNDRALFPPDKDILCVQQLHYNVHYSQTLHNVYAFTYIYKGSCSYSFNRQTLHLKQGDLFIATPGFSHQIYTVPGTFALVVMFNSAVFNILFNDFLTVNSPLSEFFRQAVARKEIGNYCVIAGDADDEELRFYLQSMVCECFSDSAYANTNATSLLKLFLSRACIKYPDRLTIYKREFSGERANSKEILRYIRSNYQDITLAQLAEHFHYNRTYISRFIHQHYGKTLIELINDLKIEHAREYLLKTSLRISDISGLVGFESYDHFCRTFKKYTGMTPGKYRSSAAK